MLGILIFMLLFGIPLLTAILTHSLTAVVLSLAITFCCIWLWIKFLARRG